MSTARLRPLPLLLLALAGCSQSKPAPSPGAGEKASTVSTSPSQPAPSVELPSAIGTGCPPGSAHVTRDGNTLTFTFDKFLAEASPGGSKLAVKDCTIVIPSPPDKRVSVSSFALEGELALEKGLSAKVAFDSYLQGKPSEVNTTQRDYVGPNEQPLSLTFKPSLERRLWSECGATRSLNSIARVRLTSEGEAGSGKAKPNKLTVVLDEKPCTDS